jgi:hypothetical protein
MGVILGRSSSPTLQLAMAQGALSGGGFNGIFHIANDGSILLGYDGSNCWKWNSGTSQFDNVFAESRIPSDYKTWGQQTTSPFSYGARAFAQCPTDSSRAYFLAGRGGHRGLLWKTDDGCASLTDTGYKAPIEFHVPRSLGPQMAVDPNNKDVVYFSGDGGVIHRSSDGGSTWERILYDQLPGATLSAAISNGSKTFTFGDTLPPQSFPTSNSFVGHISGTTLTVESITVPTLCVGLQIAGGGITSGTTYITALGTGTGGVGTYTLNTTQTVSAGTTLTAYAGSAGGPYAWTVSPEAPLNNGIATCGAYITGATATTRTLIQSLASGDSVFGTTISAVADNGSGLARLTVASTAGISTGRKLKVAATTTYDGIWTVTVVDSTHLDLQGSTYSSTATGCIGDLIVFGSPACIAFDTNGGTTTATINGNSVTVTKNVWIGWNYNVADGVVRSTDGGENFSTVSGNPGSARWLHISSDGVVWVAARPYSIGPDYHTNLWVYNAPYATGAWTNVTDVNATSGSIYSITTQPSTPSNVACVESSGNLWLSNNYGATWEGSNLASSTFIIPDTEPTWMQNWEAPPPPHGTVEVYMSAGMLQFDPSNESDLFFGEGIGLWKGQPDFTSFSQFQWTSQNKNQQGIIIDQLVKPPGRALVMAVQDRCGFYCPDVDTEPTGDFGIFEGDAGWIPGHSQPFIKNGWAIAYSLIDPDVQWTVQFGVMWTSADAGQSWSSLSSTWGTAKLSNVAILAANRSTDCVAMSGGGNWFTNDGGTTITACLFNDTPLPATSLSTPPSHYLVADPNDQDTYYYFRIPASIGQNYVGVFNSVTTLDNGGSSYSANDVLSAVGGTGQVTAPKIKVLTVDGSGVILTWTITDPGTIKETQLPSSPLSTTGGTGTGATFAVSDFLPVGGLWKSTDRGANWSNTGGVQGQPYNATSNGNMAAVPDNAGHLFFASGTGAGTKLLRTTDSGDTWSTVDTTAICWQVAVGAIGPGKTYPCVIMTGTVDASGTDDANPGTPGVWLSDDECVSWRRYTSTVDGVTCNAPAGNLAGPISLAADQEVFGKFYIAMGDVGYAYGN